MEVRSRTGVMGIVRSSFTLPPGPRFDAPPAQRTDLHQGAVAMSTTLIDQTQAARVLGLKNPRTLAAWRLRRCGPPFRRVGKRLVRYCLEDLLAWAARQEG